jgi:hypothetical protein
MSDPFSGQGFSGFGASGTTDVRLRKLREELMRPQESFIPELDNDPVLRLIWRGEARSVDEAEEQYLNASMPTILELFGSELSDAELCRHPLLILLRTRGSRGREDSLL